MALYVAIAVTALLLLWILLHTKTGRGDGTLVKRIHPYRRIMFYLMPTRDEALVYYENFIPADAMLAYLERLQGQREANITHMVLGAVAFGFFRNPRLNRFIVGNRLYQRRGVFVSFTAKRKKLDAEAKLAVIKMQLREDETFPELCQRINEKIGVERSDTVTYTDKELGFFTSLPRPILSAGVRIFKGLDYYNLLPKSFIENDVLYSSALVTNFGSIGMDAAFHHLMEWGNNPLFIGVGKVAERPVARDGKVFAERSLHIRWAFDERVDDGLTTRAGVEAVAYALQHPEEVFGPPEAEDEASGAPLLSAFIPIDEG